MALPRRAVRVPAAVADSGAAAMHAAAGVPGPDIQLGRAVGLGGGARQLRLGRRAAAVWRRRLLDARIRHHLCAPGARPPGEHGASHAAVCGARALPRPADESP
jgi:hypothetical protein